MIYHHRRVTCPHCHKVAERTRTVDDQILQGSPFRICFKCGKTYFDPEYKEMGLVLFEEKGGEINPWTVLWFLLSSFLSGMGLYFSIQGGFDDTGLIVYTIIFGIVALLIGIGLIRSFKTRKRRGEYHQNMIDYIEGRSGKRDLALRDSMSRLSNKAYLDALKSHGINVPDYFYQRLQAKDILNTNISNNTIDYSNAPKASSTSDPTEHDDEQMTSEEPDIEITNDLSDASDELYTIGERVIHKKYGIGTVVKVQKEGDSDMVSISFDKHGTKVFDAGIVSLKNIGDKA